jgi:hypothetical protein
MTYTTTELITSAYYASSIVAKDLETVSGSQLAEGLRWLNSLLSFKSVDLRLLPYFTQYDFTMVAQQKDYVIPNLISAETVTFFVDSVRYSTRQNTRKEFWGSAQAMNTYSLPYNWNIQRQKGGALLSFYFPPEAAYPCQIWGKFALDSTTLDEDLSDVYDDWYIDYLKFSLAQYICNEYAVTLPPQIYERIKEYNEMLINVSPRDFSMTKISSLQKDTAINYGDVNVGKGWRAPG